METKDQLVAAYVRNYNALCRYAVALTGSRDGGLDIVQLLAVRILELDDDFVAQNTEALLFTLAKRIAIDVRRKEKRLVHTPPEEMDRYPASAFDKEREAWELEQALEQSLQKYPEEMRRIYIRNKLHGEPIASLACEVGIRDVTLRKRVSRMTAALPRDILLLAILCAAINEIACHTPGISNVL